MKRLLKSTLNQVAPRTTAGFLAARARAHSHRYLAGLGMLDLNRRLSARFGDRVVSGPFAGTRLPVGACQEQLGPYLLGTYEQALHPWIERIIAAAPVRVIDVGSKFGYYVAGFAGRLPGAEVIAYDTDPWAREQTSAIANMNGIKGRVRVRSFCSAAELPAAVVPGTVILSDCEGYESALFPPGCGGAYATATLMIEIHEAIVPGLAGRLVEEFRATHNIERVGPVDCPYSGPPLDFLRLDEIARAVYEIRGEQEWALFTPSR